jgi:hypothetical protein
MKPLIACTIILLFVGMFNAQAGGELQSGRSSSGNSVVADSPGTRVPVFEEFPATEVFKGKPVRVDLHSHPDARRFRTRLTEGAAKGPNYAGGFTVVMWHCGTSCQTVAVVDAKTGRVHFPLSFATSEGVCFRVKSNLLITDPITPELVKWYDGAIPDWLKTRFFTWDGVKMTEIGSTREFMEQSCGPVDDTSE